MAEITCPGYFRDDDKRKKTLHALLDFIISVSEEYRNEVELWAKDEYGLYDNDEVNEEVEQC
jgi:hypothetical protein